MAVATDEDRTLDRDHEMQPHAGRNTSAVRAGGTFEHFDSGTQETTSCAFFENIVLDRVA
jgi:hypothetical protein